MSNIDDESKKLVDTAPKAVNGGGKSIFKNSVYKMILSAFNLLFPLLVTPYIADLFNRDNGTREALGSYYDANAIMGFFLIFAVFGVYNFGVREISKVRDNPKQLSIVFTNLFMFSIITSVVTSLIYLGFVIFGVNQSHQATYFIMVIQLAGNMLSVEWMSEAVENYGFITKKTILVRLCYVASIFIFVRTPDDIVPYGLVMSLTVVVNNLVSFIYIKKTAKFDFSELKIFKYVKPLSVILLINNVNVLYMQLDKLMIGRFLPIVSVTEYAMPANIINMIGVMLTSLLMVAVPRLSYYLGHGQKNEYLALLNKSTRSFFLFLCPCCIGLCCLSYEAMYLYTKGAYAYTAPVMAVFALRFLINSLYSIFTTQILYLHGEERAMVKILALGGGINLVLNFLLVITGQFSPISAVITTAIAELVALSTMYGYIRLKVKLPFHLLAFKNMKYLYFSLPFFAITYFVGKLELGVLLNCIVIIPACGLLYFLLLLVSRDDMLMYMLKKVFGKLGHSGRSGN